MAAQDALEGEPEALQRAILAEGLQGVLAAGGGEAAGGGLEWRDAQLIEFYQQDERCGQYFLQPLHDCTRSSIAATSALMVAKSAISAELY